MTLNPFLCIDLSISDSLRSVRKSVLIYETIIAGDVKSLKFMVWMDFWIEIIIDIKQKIFYYITKV